MNDVELIGVSMNYGGRSVLDNISIAFKKGTVTAILGRSGSGKTTLLKCINGIVKPTSGTVKVSGKTGYVIQGGGLFPHFTVEENISLPGKIAGQPGDVAELLSFADLPLEYLDKYPWQLSGGEQQRVALCRALYLRPPVLLMDEPFGSLDSYTRDDLHEKMLELHKALNLTIIIVTHDNNEAAKLATNILEIEKGRIKSS